MTASLLLIGGLGTPLISSNLKATVALMTIWGFLYQATLGPGSVRSRWRDAIPTTPTKDIFHQHHDSNSVSCMVLQVMPFLINPSNANLGAKICLVFFFPPSS